MVASIYPNFNTKITALHLSYLKEFSDDTLSDWDFMFTYFLGQHLRNIIPLPFFQGNTFPVSSTPSLFYANLLTLIKSNYNLIAHNDLNKLTVKFIYSSIKCKDSIISPVRVAGSNYFLQSVFPESGL